jgi:hypothetical protein
MAHENLGAGEVGLLLRIEMQERAAAAESSWKKSVLA